MPSAFNVTATTNDVQLPTTRQGSVVLTISNISGKPQQGRIALAALEATKPIWLRVDGGLERTFPVAGTQQATVEITVPKDAAAGHYTFRPDVIAVQNPDEDSTQGPTLAFEVPPEPVPPPPPWWKTHLPILIAAAAAIVVLVVGGVLAYLFYFTVLVPNVVSQDVAAAQPTIVAAHLQPGTPVPQVDVSHPAGSVLFQTPVPQARVGRGSTVGLVVAQNAIVPKLISLSAEQARTTLSSKGFQLGSTSFRATLQVDSGTVVDQSPAPGAVAAPGATINLVVEQNVAVPDVTGQNELTADQNLRNAGLTVGQTTQATQGKAADSVIATAPPAKTRVVPGATVNLVVEQYTIVPDLRPLLITNVVAALQAAHLGFQVVGTPPPCPSIQNYFISSQNPAAGSRVAWNTTVQLTIGCR